MKQDYTAIFIAVKFLGIYWEFWSEYRYMEDPVEFFQRTRDRYMVKFGGKKFRMRLCYPDDYWEVTQTNVKHK